MYHALQIADLLTQLVTDTDVTMEVSSFAAVALGLTFVGTCHAASVEAMLQVCIQCPGCPTCQCTVWSVRHVFKLSLWVVAFLDRCPVADLPLKIMEIHTSNG